MKKTIAQISLLIILTFACKDSVTEPPIDNNNDIFPNSSGNNFMYNIFVYDSTGLTQSGTRKSYYNGDTTLLLTPYQIKVDTFLLNNGQSINISYFRKSFTGVFNYVGIDTTGFSGLVPDSLRSGIAFDSEYRLIYQPLSLNQTWPVYKVSADLIYIQFDLFTVNAEVISKDTVTFSYRNSNVTKEAYKIKYQATLVTDFNSPPIRFEAFSWIADGIGIIKWEGDSELINFFAGVNVYPLNSIVIEELYSSNIN